jgi:hypothetical protein
MAAGLGWNSGIAFIPPVLKVTNPSCIDPAVRIVNTLVVGLPSMNGNDWPALKKYALIGTPVGIFEREKEKGGGPGWDAVSAWARTALVWAFNTLMVVPETVPVIEAVAAETPMVGAGGAPPESLLLHAKRAKQRTKS